MRRKTISALSILCVLIVSAPALVGGDEVSQQEHEYFEKTKNEILQGRTFSNQSTAINALLTLISAFHHQDPNTLEQIFPLVKQEQFKRLLSPETRSQMLAAARKAIFCRIEMESKSPKESDLCAIFTSESPEKTIDQVWSFAYVGGAWRFAGATGDMNSWSIQARQVEAITRDILQSEAKGTEAPTPDRPTINRVLSLDGEEDSVRIVDSPSFHSLANAITIEVWVKAWSFYPENGNINSLIRKNITEGAENFFLRFRNVAGKPSVEMSIGYNHEVLKVPYDFALGMWYHLAGTYDGRSITVFIDGLNIRSEQASGPLDIDTSDLFIGKGDPEFRLGEYFHGALDELRIWNVARSSEEIRAAMNSPSTGKEKGLVVYLNFDDGTAKDLSGHGNDGILIAGAQIIESPYPSSQAYEGEKSNKLLAWWRFDNDANDSAGANHGTIYGNPAYADGRIGQAMTFDGDDYVDCGNASVLNFGTGDWAISAWIKTTQTGTYESDEQMNRGTIFANGGDEVGGIRIALILNDSELGMITLTTDDNTHNKVQTTGGTRVNDGAWHHVLGTRISNQLHVYIDGKLNGRSMLYDDYNLSGVSQHNAYIGTITDNRDKSLYKRFVGLIDEVCVFACALDANSVGALYSGEDPTIVAEQAQAPIEPQPQPRRANDVDIEGDWKGTFITSGRSIIIQIRKKADSTLTGTITADETTIPLSKVDFTNGKLHLEAVSLQIVIEGRTTENGETIEGQLQQPGQQMMAVTLKRIEQVNLEAGGRGDSDMATDTSGQPAAGQSDGGGSLVTTLILLFILAGMIGGVVRFVMKSSIRR